VLNDSTNPATDADSTNATAYDCGSYDAVTNRVAAKPSRPNRDLLASAGARETQACPVPAALVRVADRTGAHRR
jgi:hypothetical protein